MSSFGISNQNTFPSKENDKESKKGNNLVKEDMDIYPSFSGEMGATTILKKFNIPNEEQFEEIQNKIQKKANDVLNDRKEIKKVIETNQKEKTKLEMTLCKAGLKYNQSKQEDISQATEKRKIFKGMPTNVQKALEYYDIVYSK